MWRVWKNSHSQIFTCVWFDFLLELLWIRLWWVGLYLRTVTQFETHRVQSALSESHSTFLCCTCFQNEIAKKKGTTSKTKEGKHTLCFFPLVMPTKQLNSPRTSQRATLELGKRDKANVLLLTRVVPYVPFQYTPIDVTREGRTMIYDKHLEALENLGRPWCGTEIGCLNNDYVNESTLLRKLFLIHSSSSSFVPSISIYITCQNNWTY